MDRTYIWAHRGFSLKAPENTMQAFKAAAVAGADGIEADVRLSGDGQAVICHDATVDRVSSGKGPVSGMTLSELLALDFSKGTSLRPVRIATFLQALYFCRDNKLILDADLKYETGTEQQLNKTAAFMTKKTKMEQSVVFSSFDGERLLEIKNFTKSRTALIYSLSVPSKKPWRYAKKYGFDELNPYYKLIYDGGMAEKSKKAGIPVNPWTVNRRGDIERAISVHVNAVITDRPDIASEVRRL